MSSRARASLSLPVRRLVDGLIAAVAIRERAILLHNDRDFETLARCTKLRTSSG